MEKTLLEIFNLALKIIFEYVLNMKFNRFQDLHNKGLDKIRKVFYIFYVYYTENSLIHNNQCVPYKILLYTREFWYHHQYFTFRYITFVVQMVVYDCLFYLVLSQLMLCNFVCAACLWYFSGGRGSLRPGGTANEHHLTCFTDHQVPSSYCH